MEPEESTVLCNAGADNRAEWGEKSQHVELGKKWGVGLRKPYEKSPPTTVQMRVLFLFENLYTKKLLQSAPTGGGGEEKTLFAGQRVQSETLHVGGGLLRRDFLALVRRTDKRKGPLGGLQKVRLSGWPEGGSKMEVILREKHGMKDSRVLPSGRTWADRFKTGGEGEGSIHLFCSNTLLKRAFNNVL